MRRAQYAQRLGVVSYRRNRVSLSAHYTRRRRHRVSRRAHYARRLDECAQCAKPLSYGCHRVARQKVVYTQRIGVVSYKRHRVSPSARYTRRPDVLCTVCPMDAIAFRDVHNTHDVRAYARHGGVTCPPVNCATCTVRSMPRRKSYKRLQRVVLTTSGFATYTLCTTPRRSVV